MKTAKELFEKNKKDFYCKKRIPMISDLIINIIRKNNDEGGFILLDVGCGVGSLFDNLITYKKVDCYGIEAEESYAAFAKARGHNAIPGDFTNIEIKEDYFDVITISEVLEHINEPMLVLEKIYKSLKEKGTLIITVPSLSLYRFLFLYKVGMKEKAKISNSEHYFEFSPDIYKIESSFWYSYNDLFSWLKKAGFKTKEVRGIGSLDFPGTFKLLTILGAKTKIFDLLDEILSKSYKIFGCRSLLVIALKEDR